MEIDTNPTHPNPVPDTYHRKIELQSPLDLFYLQSNLQNSAQQKLDLHFPPSALQQKSQPATIISLDGTANRDASAQSQLRDLSTENGDAQKADNEQEDDPLRARVRALVNDFLDRTWGGACQNITINGLDATSITLPNGTAPDSMNDHTSSDATGEREGIDFTYEAYDARLQQKVASLYGELETLTAQVSKLRREAPRKGAESYNQRLRELMDGEDAQFEKVRLEDERKRKDRKEQLDVLQLDPVREGQYDDMRQMYERGTAELARLGGLSGGAEEDTGRGKGTSLTETIGKVQRARTVAMELE